MFNMNLYMHIQSYSQLMQYHMIIFTDNHGLPPFSLIQDCGKLNTCGNVSKISVSVPCY